LCHYSKALAAAPLHRAFVHAAAVEDSCAREDLAVAVGAVQAERERLYLSLEVKNVSSHEPQM
jgi:hypothetical protein